MKTRFCYLSLIFTFFISTNVQSQGSDIDVRVGKITQSVTEADSNTFAIVNNLFSSIQRAILLTDSLEASIDSTKFYDVQTADTIIEILSGDVLPIYQEINQNREIYGHVVENFRAAVFDDGYTVKDLVENRRLDLARQKNELHRLMSLESRSEVVKMKIVGQELIIEQLNAQIEYLKGFQKRLEAIRNFSTTTEKDISIFLAASEINEQVLIYVIQTIKLWKKVEEFLKVAGSLASIKELSQNMLRSVTGLNDSVKSLIEKRAYELRQPPSSVKLPNDKVNKP